MTVLYDEDCGFCRVSVALVLAWDRRRRLRPAPIQSPEGARLLAGLPEERWLESAHVVDQRGALRSAGAVAEPVLQRLPGGRPLAWIAGRAPRLAERVYAALAASRGRIGSVLPSSLVRWADRRIAARSG
jgi:predicted DCC family thiol-disulfide oxidoreductase YuxK